MQNQRDLPERDTQGRERELKICDDPKNETSVWDWKGFFITGGFVVWSTEFTLGLGRIYTSTKLYFGVLSLNFFQKY